MKNPALSGLSVLLILVSCIELSAQKPGYETITRCATMQRAASRMLNNSSQIKSGSAQRSNDVVLGPVLFSYRLTSTVTVPVVVHIVLPNPYTITDADVQAQIDRLNLDFAGLNADSMNVPPAFLAVRGHSQIQFCLAKRTPDGLITSGIERRVSAVGSGQGKDPIKFTSLGGLNQWDPASYLNLWVGADDSGGDILGYAQFPGAIPTDEDGVFINYRGWGVSTCYTIPSYNKGRTATHEIGHYFGLLHNWGDDDGCVGDDFRSLTGLTNSCTLPAGLFNPDGKGNTIDDIGDTPNQAGETTNCPSGSVTDACATQAPGKMYQDHMDYSLDACLTMFTNKQVERMEWVLDNCRASIKTSLGCQAPISSITRDAAPMQSVNPGGFELNGCTTKSYSPVVFCPGSFIPKLRVINNASTFLTSVTAGYQLDNGTAVTQTVNNLNLPLGGTTVVSFPAISLVAGTHEFEFFTVNPNGGTDQVPANDTLSQSFTVNGMASAPFKEDFTGPAFPPANWSIINPDKDTTWQRSATGNVNAGSAFMHTFEYSRNDEKDELVTPRISYSSIGVDSMKLSFDLASATYTNIDDPDNADVPMDTLEILVTKDCGNSFTTVYKKWGKDLRTVNEPKQDEFAPIASEWRKETVDMTAFLNQSPIQVFFRVINNYENNLFIDNVNVFTSAVPAILKSRGYLIVPNPFADKFLIWHYTPPTDLRSVRVYNSIGQLLWNKGYNANTDNVITVNLFGKPAGIYVVRVEYGDTSKNFSQQVIKY